MKFAFTDDQQVFAETLSEVFAKRCPPEVVRACWDSPTGYSEELWSTLAEMGVLAVTAPETAGGLGGDERDLVQLMEAAGRAAAPLPLLEHVAVGVPALAEAAVSSHAAERWLEGAVTGEILVTAGISDTIAEVSATSGTAGSEELSGNLSTAREATDKAETSNTDNKPNEGPSSEETTDSNSPAASKNPVISNYVNYAAQADVAILSHEGELYAVERNDYQAHEQPSVDGTRRIARVEWSPDAATPLPGASVSLAFDRGTTAAAAICVGLAQHMLNTTVEYVKEREQFGKPVGSYQAVKHHLAEVAKAVSFARPSVYAAAWAVAQSAVKENAVSENSVKQSTPSRRAISETDRAQYVSAAKSLASDAADLAAAKCLQCHGAIGYTFEHDLQLWLKRAWTTSVSWGSATHHRHRLASLLGI